MLALQYLALAFGTILIRSLHAARRRLTGEDKYFSFSDLLVEEQHVPARGFLYMALPPFVGGFVIAFIPAIHPMTAAGAGFMAAFIGVWPVFKFPYHLLDEYLLPYWDKLKILYVLFVGFSTSLAYVGFLAARETVPLVAQLTGSAPWRQFLDDVAANAIYDIVKGVVITLFVASGIYLTRERKRIGAEIGRKKEEAWKAQMADYERRNALEGFKETLGDTSRGEDLG